MSKMKSCCFFFFVGLEVREHSERGTTLKRCCTGELQWTGLNRFYPTFKWTDFLPPPREDVVVVTPRPSLTCPQSPASSSQQHTSSFLKPCRDLWTSVRTLACSSGCPFDFVLDVTSVSSLHGHKKIIILCCLRVCVCVCKIIPWVIFHPKERCIWKMDVLHLLLCAFCDQQ